MNMKDIRTDAQGYESLVTNGEVWRIVARVPFIYELPVVQNLAVNAISNAAQVQFDQSSDFMWTHSCYDFSLANAAYTDATRPIPNMSVIINDSGSGRNLQNSAVPVGHVFGKTGEPLPRPAPYLVSGGSTLSFTFTNFDAAVANGVLRCSLIGQQIYFGERIK